MSHRDRMEICFLIAFAALGAIAAAAVASAAGPAERRLEAAGRAVLACPAGHRPSAHTGLPHTYSGH